MCFPWNLAVDKCFMTAHGSQGDKNEAGNNGKTMISPQTDEHGAIKWHWD